MGLGPPSRFISASLADVQSEERKGHLRAVRERIEEMSGAEEAMRREERLHCLTQSALKASQKSGDAGQYSLDGSEQDPPL